MNIFKQFAKYVASNILGMLGISVYIIADTFFISKAAGTKGLTVLNLALPIFNIMFGIGSMIGIGSATRYMLMKTKGEEDADTCLTNGIFWNLLLSLPFVLAGIFAPDLVMRLMGASEESVALGQGYFRIILIVAPFFMNNYIFNGMIRNDKSPVLAMAATLSGAFANVLFDYIFMFPMGMGIEGAALATASCPILGIFLCSLHWGSKKNTIRWVWKRPSLRLLGRSCALGVSAMVGELTSAVTTFTFNLLLLSLVGDIGVAAYGVVANLSLVAIAIFNGIAQGSQPLLSREYAGGAGKQVRSLLRMGLILAACLALLIISASFLWTDGLVAIFNSEGNAKMAEYAFDAVRIYFLGIFFAALNIVLTGYFSATDQAKAAALMSVLRGFALIVPAAILLSHLLGLHGVWMSYVLSEGLTTLAGVILWIVTEKTRGQRTAHRGETVDAV